MHLFRFALSLEDNVDSTRSSILEASRYFWIERMILIAQRDRRCLSYASTTFPNVPCPSNLIIESEKSASVSRISHDHETLTSIRERCIWVDHIVAIVIIILFVGSCILRQTIRTRSNTFSSGKKANLHRERPGQRHPWP